MGSELFPPAVSDARALRTGGGFHYEADRGARERAADVLRESLDLRRNSR